MNVYEYECANFAARSFSFSVWNTLTNQWFIHWCLDGNLYFQLRFIQCWQHICKLRCIERRKINFNHVKLQIRVLHGHPSRMLACLTFLSYGILCVRPFSFEKCPNMTERTVVRASICGHPNVADPRGYPCKTLLQIDLLRRMNTYKVRYYDYYHHGPPPPKIEIHLMYK